MKAIKTKRQHDPVYEYVLSKFNDEDAAKMIEGERSEESADRGADGK